MKSFVWVLSLLVVTSSAQAGILGGLFGSPCDELLWRTDTLQTRLDQWNRLLNGERGPQAVEEIRRSVIGIPSDLPAPLAVSPPEQFEQTFEPYLSAFEALQGQGPIIEVFYKSNDSKGTFFHRSGNPNIRLQVPENFREVALQNLFVFEDNTSGHQLFVIGGLTDETGAPAEIYFVNDPGGFHSDIHEMTVKGRSARELRDVLQPLGDFEHFGLLENLRPAGVLQWTKDSIGSSLRLVYASNGTDPGTYVNLKRVKVENTEHGSDFSINTAVWYAGLPLIDPYARPTNLWSATRDRWNEHQESFTDQLEQLQTPEEIATYADSAYNDAFEAAESVHAAFRNTLLYERIDYLAQLWKIVLDHNRANLIQQASELFHNTLNSERSRFDFQNLHENLDWISQFAASTESQLDSAIQTANAKLADANVLGDVRTALMNRKAELAHEKAEMSQLQVDILNWQKGVQNVLDLANQVSTEFFGRTLEASGRHEVRDLKADLQVVGDFGQALDSLRGDLAAFETYQDERAKQQNQ
jgi:hypothetical protein